MSSSGILQRPCSAALLFLFVLLLRTSQDCQHTVLFNSCSCSLHPRQQLQGAHTTAIKACRFHRAAQGHWIAWVDAAIPELSVAADELLLACDGLLRHGAALPADMANNSRAQAPTLPAPV